MSSKSFTAWNRRTVNWSARPAYPEELGWIQRCWLETFMAAQPLSHARRARQGKVPAWPRALLDPTYRIQVMQPLLARCHVCVGCTEQDPSAALGFICAERYGPAKVSLIHMIYVNPQWRCLGLAKRMAKGAGIHQDHSIIATFWNDVAGEIGRSNMIYNPLALYEVRHDLRSE
jgi:hypothetical protein